ncbi:MAG: hypothetical protein QOK43_1107 [Acidimicrobiaceae bacterium]|nr:hypothetical protein [Acidimicrobiaceae bacterium]
MLRPALELAWAVARSGLGERPPVEPPRSLRPLLRFAKLPPRGLAVVRDALDADLSFLARAAAAAAQVGEEELGRASWLFLVRPADWQAELDALVEQAVVAEVAGREAATEARAQRRLAGAEQRISRLEADLAAARGREAAAVEELAAVRRARQAAGRRVEEAESARDAAWAEVERLKAELAARPLPEPVVAPVVVPVVEPVGVSVPEPWPAVDVAGVRAALEAALALLPLGDGEAAEPPSPSASLSTARRSKRLPRPSTGAPRRRPVALPPGIHDDSTEAAEHLVRTSGVVLLVDGYNATLAVWPDVPLAEQRTRLVDALAELAARTGAEPTAVFDGAEDADGFRGRAGGGARAGAGARGPVKVVFSAADVAADDVILELVDHAPRQRPVVVASDDRQVQDGARQRSANVLSRAQLLATLRRRAR